MDYEDMFKLATSYLGISPFVYYEMTPLELNLMFEGYTDKYKNDIEYMAIANKIAIINAMSKKNYKVFSKNEDSKEIDPVFKKQSLEELKSLFS